MDSPRESLFACATVQSEIRSSTSAAWRMMGGSLATDIARYVRYSDHDYQDSTCARSPSAAAIGGWQVKARPGRGARHTQAAACPSLNPRP